MRLEIWSFDEDKDPYNRNPACVHALEIAWIEYNGEINFAAKAFDAQGKVVAEIEAWEYWCVRLSRSHMEIEGNQILPNNPEPYSNITEWKIFGWAGGD